MKYVGIDLGTTNSAIASYDGAEVTLYKSPEQHDVTPSAIYFDRRGNRFVGARAYNNSALDPDNAALLFKRLMGTGTKLTPPNLGSPLKPEDCSAEILKTLFGYLPETLRRDNVGTVITVPAAFNQMQKDATLSAAEQAEIGRVALMQEPVAAVMSVMRKRRSDGVFLIYDLGGGTLDVAVAQSIGGRVSLLAHGGISMCGGRDFDRMLVDSVVQPWLHANFNLGSSEGVADPKRLFRLCSYAAERAKIELSQKLATTIALSETELNCRDADGVDLYLDVPLDRSTFDRLIEEQLAASIDASRDALSKAGLDPADVERVVFVGGPTQYGPLREKVSFELGIASSTEVNPMTAVAEGAAIFAENLDWTSASRGRKSSRGQIASASLSATFHFVARTPAETARISVDAASDAPPGAEFQIDSLDTGWSSGRLPLQKGKSVEVPLSRMGDNEFKALVFDSAGQPHPLPDPRLVITKTAATIDGIPASHSIGIEVKESVDGAIFLDHLIKQGELLPKRGVRIYRAGTTLQPGDETVALNFRIWEGEISDPITHNRSVGVFSVKGSDLEDRPILAGAELRCEYEVTDSGNIILQVEVPSVGSSFNSGRNFYSRLEGQIDFDRAEQLLLEEAGEVESRIELLEGHVPEDELELVKRKVDRAEKNASANDAERAKQASEELQEAKQLLAAARSRHLQTIRTVELEQVCDLFNGRIRELAEPGEAEAFDASARAAEAVIAKPGSRFEALLDSMRGRIFAVLWRQDDFLVARFEHLAQSPHLFPDLKRHRQLVDQGVRAMEKRDMSALRGVIIALDDIRVGTTSEADLMATANIIRGG